MHRRGRAQFRGGFVGGLLALLTVVLAVSASAAPTGAAPPTDETAPTTVATDGAGDEEPPPTRPVVTVSEFFPDDRNLSECVGLVEKPGCGSEARGGWRQAAVLGALAIGLGIIAWRISVGLRRNRHTASDSGTARPTGGRDPSSRRSP